jgi:hypothetical protein
MEVSHLETIEQYLVRLLAARAGRRIGNLATELAQTPSGSREGVLAELEYQRWLWESCHECL